MMGCDIHSYTEKKTEQGYESVDFAPFDWRSYGMYAFLAGVRNYSGITPIAEPRDLPDDVSSAVKQHAEDWNGDGHTHSWLSVKELTEFDYDQMMEDRRVTKQISANCWSGAQTCEAGEGTTQTYREFLGNGYFNDLEKLKILGADRIVFWFDN
jgi:hypothetical protein